MPTVAVLKKNRGGIEVEIPFDMGWKHAITTLVPKSDRSNNGRVWFFDPKHYHCVLAVTKHHVDRVIDQVGDVPEPQSNLWKQRWADLREEANIEASGIRNYRIAQPKKTDYEILCLTSAAPPELIRMAYRVLAKLYHPDMPGGSVEKMQAVNAAYKNLMPGSV
jgi:hypothetical protein